MKPQESRIKQAAYKCFSRATELKSELESLRTAIGDGRTAEVERALIDTSRIIDWMARAYQEGGFRQKEQIP